MAKKNNTPAKQESSAKPAVKGPLNKELRGAPFNEQDPKRRLGNFTGAGEHARQGSRASGIVGQTKQKNKTDKESGK